MPEEAKEEAKPEAGKAKKPEAPAAKPARSKAKPAKSEAESAPAEKAEKAEAKPAESQADEKKPAAAETKADEKKPEPAETKAGKKPATRKKKEKKTYFWGTGRRKTSVARVRIRPGTGVFQVNGKGLNEYFCIERLRAQATSALTVTNTGRKVDVFVNVKGGGPSGQAGAIILGTARALLKMDEGLESVLRSGGFMTRDARKVERKKYGRAGARKSFQFSKR